MNHNGNGFPKEHDFLSRLRKVNGSPAKRWALTDARSNCETIVTRCLNHLESADDEDPVTGLVRDLLTKAIDLAVRYDTLIHSKLIDFNVDQISQMFMPVGDLLAEVFQEINPSAMDKVSAAL